MTRVGHEAIAWSIEHAERPPAGLGGRDGTWHNMCLQYVRSAFGRPGGIPNAGLAYDLASFRHQVPMTEAGVKSIPRAVPVFFELASVEDHIFLGLGSGLGRSTDAVVRGQANVVSILALAHRWGATAIRWTEDLNHDRVWSPPKTPEKTPNITAVLRANARSERAAAAHRVIKHGSPPAKKAAKDLLNALDLLERGENRRSEALKTLRNLEVK